MVTSFVEELRCRLLNVEMNFRRQILAALTVEQIRTDFLQKQNKKIIKPIYINIFF